MDRSNEVARLSKELNEPKWLLQERLKALKVYSVLSKGTGYSPDSFCEADTDVSLTGARKDSLHAFLDDSNKKDIARSFFTNRFFRPEKSVEAAFINAFFTECNFFAPERESATISLKRRKGITIDFFILLARSSLGLDSDPGGANISEYYLSDNSSLFHSCLAHSSSPLALEARILQNNAQLYAHGVFLSSCNRSNSVLLNGEGASYKESSVFVSSAHGSIAMDNAMIHAARSTESIFSMKGVAKDSSTASVKASARIEREAKGAKSSLATHAMLLDPGARAEARPEFEILNDEVKASHSASVGEIDKEKLFYLMSRGIGNEAAKQAIVEGFLGSAFKVAPRQFREKAEGLISAIYKSSHLK